MHDHDAILRAIIDEPLDDGLRRIFADALEDAGEPDLMRRAAFVRWTMGDSYAPAAAALRHYDEKAWLRHLLIIGPGFPSGCWEKIGRDGGGLSLVVFRRGFASVIKCTFGFWHDHGPAVAASHPVEHVAIVDPAYAPRREGEEYVWYRSNDPDTAWRRPDGVTLPLGLWDAAYPGMPEEAWVARHDSEKAAADALSAGLIRWARRPRHVAV